MFRITAGFLRRTDRCLRIAKDILIVPRQWPTRNDMITLGNLTKTDKKILRILPDYQQERIRYESPSEILNSIRHLYIDHCDTMAQKLSGKRTKKMA